MTPTDIRARLLAERDDQYAAFQRRIITNIAPERIIGVRTPVLRRLAKEWKNDADAFLADLPHGTFDENQLHSFLVGEVRDFDRAVSLVEAFLPFVDNWATCDLLSPKIFKKNRDKLGREIERWLSSGKTYTVRFGIEMIQSHYLDEDFDEKWLGRVAQIRSDEYYINMMIAWFFATALTKQWDATVPYIENHTLDVWTHNTTIQKARESYCISDEKKEYLKLLKI